MEIGVEGWSDGRRIFWFSDVSRLEVILDIGVISRSPLGLPPDVVGIAGGLAHLVVLERL